MFEILIQMFLGWPAMILSLVFAVVGIVLKRSDLSSAGAVLLLPPAWYLSHYSLAFAILPLLLFGSAYAVFKNMTVRAILLIVPVLIAIAGLGIFVLTQ
jgi:hypothetical protein